MKRSRNNLSHRELLSWPASYTQIDEREPEMMVIYVPDHIGNHDITAQPFLDGRKHEHLTRLELIREISSRLNSQLRMK
ncbi:MULTISPECIES: hypothetical protein [Pseudescherichia]|uniref:hypothetical protein n=1 Tax=Pseudescherichia TaxID=2055880 RepID=UPI0028ABB4DD|nr:MULTISPECIES: hypothetical protein [Pseudescherichia]